MDREAEFERKSVCHCKITTGIQSGFLRTHSQLRNVLIQFYSCLIIKTDGVSVSSPALSGGWCWHYVCMPACVEENSEGTVDVYAARVEETLPSKCACTGAAGGPQCQNAPQRLSWVQFSLLHPLCSFILSLPFIYLYPFPHLLLPWSTPPPLLFSVRWEWKKTPRLCTWHSTLHAQPEEGKHKSTSIKNKRAAGFTHQTCCYEGMFSGLWCAFNADNGMGGWDSALTSRARYRTSILFFISNEMCS